MLDNTPKARATFYRAVQRLNAKRKTNAAPMKREQLKKVFRLAYDKRKTVAVAFANYIASRVAKRDR